MNAFSFEDVNEGAYYPFCYNISNWPVYSTVINYGLAHFHMLVFFPFSRPEADTAFW